jgi:hypothetical protein
MAIIAQQNSTFQLLALSSQVYNSYGFRIAFEASAHSERRSNCSLLACSLNGECLVDFDSQAKNIR